jgi:hypothetical protein
MLGGCTAIKAPPVSFGKRAIMPKSPHLPESGVDGHSPGGPDPAAPPSRVDTAHYIEEMAGELSRLARNANLELLAYLLDMVKLEARKNTGRFNPP